jgi:orotate phosphoribosyltransferase
MKNIAKETANSLLKIEAVQFNFTQPFRWSSGWLSPIYCDCRLSLSYPEVRNFITESFAEIANKYFREAEAIAGVATAGIPQAALIAQKLNLPMLYVRAKAKEHGKENLIEGKLKQGQ